MFKNLITRFKKRFSNLNEILTGKNVFQKSYQKIIIQDKKSLNLKKKLLKQKL